MSGVVVFWGVKLQTNACLRCRGLDDTSDQKYDAKPGIVIGGKRYWNSRSFKILAGLWAAHCGALKDMILIRP